MLAAIRAMAAVVLAVGVVWLVYLGAFYYPSLGTALTHAASVLEVKVSSEH